MKGVIVFLLGILILLSTAANISAQTATAREVISLLDAFSPKLDARGAPFTERQLNYLNGLEAVDRNSIVSILTDEQKVALGVQHPFPALIRSLSRRIEDAGVPLSDQQLENLYALKTADREAVLAILTDEQQAVLNKPQPDQPPDNSEYIRRLNQRLDERDVPLSDEQIESLLGQEILMWGYIVSILTDEQKTALNIGTPRVRTSEELPGIDPLIQHLKERLLEGDASFALRLKETGMPLTERQINYLKGLNDTSDIKRALLSILSDEQKTALGMEVKERPDATIRPGAVVRFLDQSGFPLSEEQMLRLRELATSGSLTPELMRSVLTPEQQVVFDKQFGANNGELGDETQKPTEVDNLPEAVDALHQNYPNPFNPSTTISYHLVRPGNVTVEVFDNTGRLVERLVNEYQDTGAHAVEWDASPYAAGVYIYRIDANGFSDTGRMSYIK